MLVRSGIYLDSNAGAPLRLEVTEALLPFLKGNGGIIANPSSIHSHGRIAKRAMAEAREQIVRSLGERIDPEQFLFTSSGTEANQLSVRSVLESHLILHKKPHWITTAVEHDSNRQMVSWLEQHGGSVTLLPVSPEGIPQVENLASLMRPETALVSVLWVNNETGVITPIQKFSELTQLKGIPLHVDAAQAWGKLPIDLETLGAQWVTFSGHKIGGIAGTGGLWLAPGQVTSAVLLGKQEKGRRGGTENLLGIIACGAAARSLEPLSWSVRVARLRDRLEKVICERIPGTEVNGQGADRIANTLNLNFEGVEGDGLVMALDLAGYSVSSGSACSSGVLEPSHVLLAMGRTRMQSMAAIRVSLTDELAWELLEGFVITLEKVVSRVRGSNRSRSDF